MGRGSGPASILDLLEPGWRNHLQAGGLAAAVDIEPGLPRTVARTLGGLVRQHSPGTLAQRWPGCVTVALACVAADDYRRGEFWPGWHRACGTRASRAAETAWGEAFLDALRLLGRVAPAGVREAVLVHTAVPTSCLDEVLRLLASYDDDDADAASEALARVDPAVELLLRYGGEAGRELLARCRAALLTTEDAPELPRRYWDAARRSHPASAGPPLRLDPYGRGVLLATGASQRHWRSATPREAGADGVPLLVFDEDGTLLRGALPPEAVWALRPAESDLLADVALRTVVESRLPLPWQGWRLTQVTLEEASWLAAGADRRQVRGRARPRLVPGPAVPGTSTRAGLTVHRSPPSVRLPAGEARWRVEARRAEGGPVLGRVESTAQCWDDRLLWARAPRPLLGEVVVTAVRTDGGGAGMRRTVFLAEGLDARYRPTLRLACGTGLEPAEALLDTGPGLTAAPGAVMLPAQAVSAEVRVVAGPTVSTLRVTPPHARVRIEPEPADERAPMPWHSAGPLPLSAADLRRGGSLRLDLPGLTYAPPMEVVVADRTVQWLEPSGQGRYPLRRLLDTVAAHGAVELRITVDGRDTTVARVSAATPVADPWLPTRAGLSDPASTLIS